MAHSMKASERAALQALAHGLSSSEIGATLGISQRSARRLLNIASRKLEARSATHAALLAFRAGLISLSE